MTRKVATAEEKRDTGPLPASAPEIIARQPQRSHWLWPLIGLGAALLVAGLVFAVLPGGGDQQPVEVVKGFVAAVEARDVSKMLSYIEPTVIRREISPEIRAYMAYIEQIRFTDPHYELLDNDGRTARVRWTCSMGYQLRERGAGQRVVDTTFELVKIEGAWYLRGVRLPPT